MFQSFKRRTSYFAAHWHRRFFLADRALTRTIDRWHWSIAPLICLMMFIIILLIARFMFPW